MSILRLGRISSLRLMSIVIVVIMFVSFTLLPFAWVKTTLILRMTRLLYALVWLQVHMLCLLLLTSVVLWLSLLLSWHHLIHHLLVSELLCRLLRKHSSEELLIILLLVELILQCCSEARWNLLELLRRVKPKNLVSQGLWQGIRSSLGCRIVITDV